MTTPSKTELQPKSPVTALLEAFQLVQQAMTTAVEIVSKMEAPVAPPAKKSKPKTQAGVKKPRVRTAPDTVEAFVQWFIQSPVEDLYNVKCGQWACKLGDPAAGTAHVLTFTSALLDGNGIDRGANIMALRSTTGNPVPVFNASNVAYGTSYSRAQKTPQEMAERFGAVPVPFETVIKAAKLDLFKTKVLDWAGSERMPLPPVSTNRYTTEFELINRHFAGAVALEIDGSYFLFDCDREEVKYGKFNPFFTQLPSRAETVKAAYELLIPAEVKQAMDAGISVQRQGEFFFVKADDAEVAQKLRVQSGKSDAYVDEMYPVIMMMADEVGANDYNNAISTTRAEVRNWLHKYQIRLGDKPKPTRKRNSSVASSDDSLGVLDKTEPETLLDPAGAVAFLLKWTETQVGPSGARVNQNTEKPYSNAQFSYNAQSSASDRMFTQELTFRLNERGIDAAFGMRYQLRLTQVNETDRNSRGHTVTLGAEVRSVGKGAATVHYARGYVHHNGREHRPLYLDGWHRVYTNTAFASYTVSGDVD